VDVTTTTRTDEPWPAPYKASNIGFVAPCATPGHRAYAADVPTIDANGDRVVLRLCGACAAHLAKQLRASLPQHDSITDYHKLDERLPR
jgi:hypothetical protein